MVFNNNYGLYRPLKKGEFMFLALIFISMYAITTGQMIDSVATHEKRLIALCAQNAEKIEICLKRHDLKGNKEADFSDKRYLTQNK